VRAALELVEPGMRLALGSGRAVWAVADALATSSARPELVVCASPETARRAKASGLVVAGPEHAPGLDLALDGADEVMRDLSVLKGGGGALLREKLLIACARRCVILAESPKLVDRLGDGWRLPVEVVRFAWEGTCTRLLTLLDDAERRNDGEGAPFVSDEGHYLLDCAIPRSADLAQLAAAIKATTGVVDHGLFLEQAAMVLLGAPDGSLERLVRPGTARDGAP
jgi:ribose 5-phosphate isomerase A